MKEKLAHYRLSPVEYDRICSLLKREPVGIEWALFSALWSEHCSYKSSRVHLKKFSYKSSRVLESFGENAGVVDLGQGERVAFKMESHNHPSFIEPFQGAATGVGGILRDIFTMGARPIALANYLCFGAPQAARMQDLVKGVVGGISGYGNCVGVATITGQTEFHSSYNGNILVNALALGLLTEGQEVVNSRARGVGNKIMYVGAKTGRDGVHGASMASEEFDEKSESKRPTIQIGDPFYEKLLIESCLEVFEQKLVVAIQDMGAAGLTSSSFEMAQKGGVGFRIDLDQVPLRDSTLTPEDILLSESQERMLLIAEPGKIEAIQKIFARYALDAAVIGEVTAGPEVEIHWHNEILTRIDPKLLTDNAPMYERPFDPPGHPHKVAALNTAPATAEMFWQALHSAQGCARQFIYQQYDQRVGARTVRDCSHAVGVIKLPSSRLLGLVLGCRPPLMRLDTEVGALDTVIYPCIELSVLGFEAVAITDCLNFGSPEKPQVMGELVQSIESLAMAAQMFEAPVISGNVSLYNETLGAAVTSTPAVGVVGLRHSETAMPKDHFVQAGDRIFLVHQRQVQTPGLWSELRGQPKTFTGALELKPLTRWCRQLRQVALSQRLHGARIVGKFGAAYTLARMATAELGCRVRLQTPMTEHLYEVLMTGGPALKAELEGAGLAFEEIGAVEESVFRIENLVQTTVGEVHQALHAGWKEHFGKLS